MSGAIGRRAAATLAICVLAWPLAGRAQVTETGDYLARMDGDGDGRVSLAEYQAWMSYAFDGMDRDGDGVLAPQEQPGGRGTSLTRARHLARLAERFARQDVDGNGFLDARELAAPPR
ncbi:hypothetical protein [Luteimonas sp. SDU101]|uniref:hypothetical protein n=1 Tax=unclassified Luteimonas TaxID=2629088 RepID=UPI003EB900AA